ncbi:dihydroorotate dehydrogenase-like protein [[Pseudopropionibacterium] massiliense]|uniref:dihydroorotate dehydrogenase-like protein n=1 Tax=[Pseudopropionibacterium] massiliense TaxID=2220000 RepID=UPI0010317EE5|nr:dihydroorotate dehydrogenase-like protein [[Pseudopropionibacterium] massiliense]
MAELRSSYLGLELRNPVVASAGPLSQNVEDIKALADAGVGAVTMFSLFEEQLFRDAERLVELEEQFADITPEATSFFPEVPRAETDAVTSYLRLVEKGARAIDVPLIASLNGASRGGWVHSARSLQDAGAAALELNIYYVSGDFALGGDEVEQRHLDILRAVKSEVDIPVAVKLSPYFSSVGAMCQRLDRAGADGLVLFNRFLQPDIDLERLEVVSGVTLSSPVDARLPRTWIAVLHDHVEASLAASSGVDQPEDVVKYLLAGADVVCTTSALVRHGIGHATRLVEGLDAWLDGRRLTLDQARGMLAVPSHTPADVYERAGYVAALEKAKTTYGSLS